MAKRHLKKCKRKTQNRENQGQVPKQKAAEAKLPHAEALLLRADALPLHPEAKQLQGKSIVITPQKCSLSTHFCAFFRVKNRTPKYNCLIISFLCKIHENYKFAPTSALACKNRKEMPLRKITLSPKFPFYLHPAKSIHQKGIHTHRSAWMPFVTFVSYLITFIVSPETVLIIFNPLDSAGNLCPETLYMRDGTTFVSEVTASMPV